MTVKHTLRILAVAIGALAMAGVADAQMTLNPDVNQATIDQTICQPGYTKTVRPSVSYTNGVKRKLIREAGLPAPDASLYELDHLVPLTLGGHPRSLNNLELQLWPEANIKDRLEPKLSKLVCAHKIPLATAQACIYNDWRTCGRKYGVK